MENSIKNKTDVELLELLVNTPVYGYGNNVIAELVTRKVINEKTTFRTLVALFDALKQEERERNYFDALYDAARAKKQELIKEDPSLANDPDFWESHSCSAFNNNGYCDWCGADLGGGW